jgi:hypothetical protein
MSFRKLLVVVVLCFVTLAAAGLVAWAQAPSAKPVPPTIISGPDLGYRMEGRDSGRAVGTLMVKINGEWVEATVGRAGVQKLTTR